VHLLHNVRDQHLLLLLLHLDTCRLRLLLLVQCILRQLRLQMLDLWIAFPHMMSNAPLSTQLRGKGQG
jgi:hypothetical protein